MNIAQQREAVIAEARTWLGTNYHHHAMVKGAGVDCAQILIAVYAACGLMPMVEIKDYAHDWHLHRSEEKYLGHIAKFMRPVDQPLPGDTALFKFGHTISHGAIIVEWPYVIHSYIGLGVVLASADDAELSGRVAGFWTPFKDAE